MASGFSRVAPRQAPCIIQVECSPSGLRRLGLRNGDKIMNRLSARFLSIGVPAFLLAASVQAGPILLQNATATFSQAGFPVSNAIDGSADANTGWAIFNFVTT